MEPLCTGKCRSETQLTGSNEERNQIAVPEVSHSGRKRKLSTSIDTIERSEKLQAIETNSRDAEEQFSTASRNICVNLLDLSDEILLLILMQLDANSLLALSTTCTRLQILVADKTLWKEADYSSVRLGTEEVKQNLNHLKPASKTLKLRGMTSVYPGDRWKEPTLTPAILESISTKCPQMRRLELTEAYLNTCEIGIVMFPNTLRSLVLRKCSLSSHNSHENSDYFMPQVQMTSFLSKIYKHLIQLEELSIEYCTWFDTHDLMVLSKLPNLRYLSLKGCANLKDSVPYASLATRFGFRKLEVLDLRDTPISDSDVSCFNIVQTLKELLLECPEHLRTDRGLEEYNQAERQRVEELHRLAVPARNRPPPGAENAAIPQVVRPPRQGMFEVRLVNGVQPAPGDNPENVLQMLRDDDFLLDNIPQRAGNNNRHPNDPPSPPLRAGQAVGGPRQPPRGNERQNNNNGDRQHIVRIINRDLLLQRREQMDLENPRRLLGRPQRGRLPAAYQQVFEAEVNIAPEPVRPQAPEPVEPDRAPAPAPAPAIERPIEQGGINVQLRFRGLPNQRQNNDQQQQRPPQQPRQDPPQQPRQDPPQQNNPVPNRVLPHVIIMPGIENIQEFFQRQANGNHQLFVNLGIGPQNPTNNVSLVSDRGICAYGVSRYELRVMNGGLQNFTKLERLSVRNYKLVTDTSLDHLESAAPHLKMLDVTGTSVTADGVRSFRLSRSNCVIFSDFDKDADTDDLAGSENQ
ncbi:AGAP004683-PA-like protein [Anopheles sinensis]|uniref:AGAP004683-PA-like protein n=1 Tax=Anopheles sinensis TaxID=74873 RepID=A0A084VJH3_ANOSI|nr:AGAP004683-PA-like protein [Anopheles sinensis]